MLLPAKGERKACSRSHAAKIGEHSSCVKPEGNVVGQGILEPQSDVPHQMILGALMDESIADPGNEKRIECPIGHNMVYRVRMKHLRLRDKMVESGFDAPVFRKVVPCTEADCPFVVMIIRREIIASVGVEFETPLPDFRMRQQGDYKDRKKDEEA
jgi:hypothetical protein